MTDTPIIVTIVDGTGIQRAADWMQDAGGNIIPQSVPRANGQPVSAAYGLPTVGHTIVPIAVTGALTLGGSAVAQGLQQATASPGITVVVCNPSTPIGQGLGAIESIWVDCVTIAQDTGGSTSIEVIPGASLTIGPTTNAISWIAVTGGHRIGAYAYL
jgi:hypothetical protein